MPREPISKDIMHFEPPQDTACLPENTEYTDDKTVLISGWGSTTQRNASQPPNYDKPAILQKASVKIVNSRMCQIMYAVPNQNGETAIIRFGMMCAASPGKSSCQGDSGGTIKLFHKLRLQMDYSKQLSKQVN